jgi:glycosyltransferase involved in cell wall biosynthesis
MAGATAPSANVRTDPGRARHVIARSRGEFVARYPDLKFSPVVGLICAYEEEDNIGAVLGAMPAEACGLPVSTLVIVDGGKDHTDRVAAEAGATTFVLSENLGHGYALRVGYALAIEFGAQFVVTLDADGQNDPVEIPVMLQPLIDDEADFVVASRRLGEDTTTDRTR